MAIKLARAQRDRRDHHRRSLHVTIPVQLSAAENGATVSCRIDDFSSEGLGVWTGRPLQVGEEVVFATLKGQFRLVVAWCQPDRRGFRCGLRLADPTVDLQTLFDCLASVDAVS